MGGKLSDNKNNFALVIYGDGQKFHAQSRYLVATRVMWYKNVPRKSKLSFL